MLCTSDLKMCSFVLYLCPSTRHLPWVDGCLVSYSVLSREVQPYRTGHQPTTVCDCAYRLIKWKPQSRTPFRWQLSISGHKINCYYFSVTIACFENTFSVFMFSCSFFSIIFLVILMTKQILYYNVYHKRFHQNGVLYAYVWSKNTSALCLQCKTTDVQTDNSLIDRLRERQILTCFLWLRV